MLLKYYPLYVQNQDLIGWISIPEFDINYPVVQCSNNKYYLTHNFEKKYNCWGTPFIDYQNTVNPNDQNIILYGHNSSVFKNRMFAPINAYLNLDGFKKAPIIKFDTIFNEGYWKVYAVFVTNSEAKDDNGYCFNYMIPKFSKKAFCDYINKINKRALYYTGVDINESDELLTISTCNYSFKNARTVIICRKIRVGETNTVDTAAAKKNQNPLYPQAWYDKKKISNPYNNLYK